MISSIGIAKIYKTSLVSIISHMRDTETFYISPAIICFLYCMPTPQPLQCCHMRANYAIYSSFGGLYSGVYATKTGQIVLYIVYIDAAAKATATAALEAVLVSWQRTQCIPLNDDDDVRPS